MPINNFIKKLITKDKDEPRFKSLADTDGLNFFLPKEQFTKCQEGEGSGLLLHQYVCLQILEEQGNAFQIANGFTVPSENAVALDNDTKHILELPPLFPGTFHTRVEGQAKQASFSVKIIPRLPNGDDIYNYQLKGPCLQISSQEIFLLSPAGWLALNSVGKHQRLEADKKNEQQNLRLIGKLQAAKKLGLNIDLSHFNKLTVYEPEKVGVSVLEQEDGSLLLIPSFGDDSDPNKINKRLGQLKGSTGVGTIRVMDNIVVLDEKRLEAAHEIISNRHVSKTQVEQFLKTPTAFLDASLVDLDLGFSLRVRGATLFKHAYFGETDESGISWFEKATRGSNQISHPSVLNRLIEDEDNLDAVVKEVEAARKTGGAAIDFAGETIDISDTEATNNILKKIKARLTNSSEPSTDDLEKDANDIIKTDPSVIDIIENDEEQEYGSTEIPAKIDEVLFKGLIDYQKYKRQPFSHQDEGIRWILGYALQSLYLANDEESYNGSLLADDMGLGKTYVILIALAEFYAQCKKNGSTERPALIVVPLSLMENWKDEIEQTFHKNPFSDIVMLQAEADLKMFRIEGTGIETKQTENNKKYDAENLLIAPENAIKYSLKFGQEFGPNRLDMPRRIVLTTYQTLRDYQFSLCLINWSFVIFDEAQNIKNPNTLATRAAKGLRAQFKLLATGTPVENHLGDFWCLMDTACPGVLGAYQEFRQKYVLPILRSPAEKISETRLLIGKDLRSKVGPRMLRRLKEDNLKGLPKKNIFVGTKITGNNGNVYEALLENEMQGEQLQRYDTAINVVVEAKNQGDNGNPVLSGLHQLREISLHPLLLNRGIIATPNNSSEAHKLLTLSGKLASIIDILDQIKKRNEKAIIFLINKRLQSFLKIALNRKYNIKVEIINGDTKAISKSKKHANQTRKGIIDNFQSQQGFGIIIMSPIAAGTGLTVVAANNVIHLERHWNPAKEDQATDRVYRIGQKKEVNVYLPILKHPSIKSFDENLHSLLSNKVTLKDAVVTPDEVSNDEMREAVFGAAGKTECEEAPLRGKDFSYLSWQEFEAMCAELYGQYYNSEAFLTPTNDFGADVIILGSKNILIQCKYTTNKRYDSRDPLIEIHGAKPAYEERMGKTFSSLLVVSSAKKYSKRIVQEAKTYNVELFAHQDLDKLLKKHPVSRKQIQRRLLAKRIFQ